MINGQRVVLLMESTVDYSGEGHPPPKTWTYEVDGVFCEEPFPCETGTQFKFDGVDGSFLVSDEVLEGTNNGKTRVVSWQARREIVWS